MLRSYTCQNDRLVLLEGPPPAGDGEAAVWFDLVNPTPEEDRLVEQRLGISVPTRDEMEEIELSARLYHEDGAEYMTMTAVTSPSRRRLPSSSKARASSPSVTWSRSPSRCSLRARSGRALLPAGAASRS